MKFVMMLRCEPTAPLGWPVVPDVYSIVTSSSASRAMSGGVAKGSTGPRKSTERVDANSRDGLAHVCVAFRSLTQDHDRRETR